MRQIRDVRRKIREGSEIREAVSQVTRCRLRRFSGGSVPSIGRCISGLKGVVSALDRGIKEGSRYQDGALRIFPAEKRRVPFMDSGQCSLWNFLHPSHRDFFETF